MKKGLKTILAILLALVLLVAGYLAYVLIDYHRIGDQVLEIAQDGNGNQVQTDTEYRMMSWNVGFGAYEQDYSFFMDGGTESWAWSEERLNANIGKMADLVTQEKPDFCIMQEVDRNATRSYHVDEYPVLGNALIQAGYDSTFCVNYDSPFLMYPFTQPHGKSLSGLATFVNFDLTAANRVSLPVEDSLMKLVDLDRCYSVNHIAVEDGKDLVLYNVHLSAYTSDGTIAVEQLKLLLADMQSEYEKGNYVICGGDFNKDLSGDCYACFHQEKVEESTWAQPLPDEIFDGTNLSLTMPLDPEQPVASCRTASAPYFEGQFVITVDGFIVSDNVTVHSAEVIDTQYRYSDHNPIRMSFSLNG